MDGERRSAGKGNNVGDRNVNADKIEDSVIQTGDYAVGTGGGAYIDGSVTTAGDFVGRDKITHVHVASLGDVDALDDRTKQRLRSLYEERVRGASTRAGDYLALGLFYLDRRQYALAQKALAQANELDPFHGDTGYYLALAKIAGREARTLRAPEVSAIEECLNLATSVGVPQGHQYALWAFVKYEYYLVNGLIPPPPSIDELVDLAMDAGIDSREMHYMLLHAPVCDNPLLAALGHSL